MCGITCEPGNLLKGVELGNDFQRKLHQYRRNVDMLFHFFGVSGLLSKAGFSFAINKGRAGGPQRTSFSLTKIEFCKPGYRNEAGILWQEVYESIR